MWNLSWGRDSGGCEPRENLAFRLAVRSAVYIGSAGRRQFPGTWQVGQIRAGEGYGDVEGATKPVGATAVLERPPAGF